MPKTRIIRWRHVGAALFLSISVQLPAQSAPPAADTGTVSKSTIADILKKQRELEDTQRTFRFGLSVGYRHLITKRSDIYRDAVLNPATHVVEVDSIDQGDVVLSGVVVAFPWSAPVDSSAKKRSMRWHWGFIANIDLASFGGDEITSFNRSIEGGGGLAYKLSPDFSLALTFERVFSRRLRAFVKPGEVLPVAAGAKDTVLSRDNDTYFRNDNLSALSIKFVYFFK